MTVEALDAAVREARHQLTAMLGEIETHGPLPPPSRYVPDGDDPAPGAHWDTGQRADRTWTRHHPEVQVIAHLEDVGVADPCVSVRGIDPSDVTDLHSMTVPQARRFALAVLAACDLAGSEIIAKRCAKEVR